MQHQSGAGGRTEGLQVAIPRVGTMSRSTVTTAIHRLQEQHGISEPEAAFMVLRTASQHHNVKLRVVAAALTTVDANVNGDGMTAVCEPPPLSFSFRAQSSCPNRTDVMHDLMCAAIGMTGAGCGTVQSRDPIHGGLIIEVHKGFDRSFLDFFSYVDGPGAACGATLTGRAPVWVRDVETSTMFDDEERETVLGAGVRSVLATPLRGERESVRGVIATYFTQPYHQLDDATVSWVQRLADECARWLCWYDKAVMPIVLRAVHEAAERAGSINRV
jgi:ANTAR domain-containing protein/GAF domain-containing protein